MRAWAPRCPRCSKRSSMIRLGTSGTCWSSVLSASSTSATALATNGHGTARIIAVVNQKGGVGKSTTAVNLGASLALLGRRVLIVDIDPQGNSTTGVGVDKRNVTRDIYSVLLDRAPVREVACGTDVPNLSIVPATINL